MHEFSIATQIMESVLEFAEAHQPGEVVKVRLEVGELTCVEPEQLKFCYDSIKTNTVLKTSVLEISMAAAVVKCPHCKYEGAPKYWDDARAAAAIPTLQCPQCGKAAEAVSGHDCAIKSVQFRELKDEDPVMET
jgi:hydrogenase nickel incorporation protein HypA/HybF